LRDRIRIHIRKQPREHLEDCDPSARPRVNVAEFERDHATTDKHDSFGQSVLAQHVIRGDHQLGTGERQVPRL
jgi:hypothetical protein